eukprot:14272653-Heterocapsa_arctica.AAC.1
MLVGGSRTEAEALKMNSSSGSELVNRDDSVVDSPMPSALLLPPLRGVRRSANPRPRRRGHGRQGEKFAVSSTFSEP